MTNNDNPYIAELYRDVRDHGEVHVVVEEHDAEVELRKGQTEFLWERRCVTVDGPDTEHVFDFDRFVRHYKPKTIFH